MTTDGGGRGDRLDADQTMALVAIAQDPEAPAADRSRAEETLLMAFRGLARGIANRYANPSVDRDDLNAVADRGLLDSVRRFDPSKGAGFSTYATATIAGSIKRYYRDTTWSVGVPRRIRDLTVPIRRLEAEFEQTHRRRPTAQELAAALNVELDDVLEALDALGVYATRSIHGLDDDDWSDLNRLHDEELGYAIVERREALRPALDDLPPRERTIIIGTYFQRRTQAQIAAELGVSQVHVSRLLRKALLGLRATLTAGED